MVVESDDEVLGTIPGLLLLLMKRTNQIWSASMPVFTVKVATLWCSLSRYVYHLDLNQHKLPWIAKIMNAVLLLLIRGMSFYTTGVSSAWNLAKDTTSKDSVEKKALTRAGTHD